MDEMSWIKMLLVVIFLSALVHHGKPSSEHFHDNLSQSNHENGKDLLDIEVIRPNPLQQPNNFFTSSSKICNNVLPGLNRLRRGIDITKLDLLSLSPTADDGFRLPITDFTCKSGRKINVKSQGGKLHTYDLPDQVWDVTALPGGFLSETVEIFKTSREVQKSMAVNAGVDLFGGMFSAAASFNKMSYTLANESKYLETVKTFVSGSCIDLAPFWALNVSKYASIFIANRLPKTFEEGPEKYAEFIGYFGTHYFASGKFGGIINLVLDTEKSYFLGKSESKVKAEADGTFLNILKAKGGYSGATVKVDEDFKRKTTKTIRYFGGDMNLLDAEGLRRWQPTVAENPWLFGGKVESLTTLFTDVLKKSAMKRAVQVHTDKARLKAVAKLIYGKLRIWTRPADNRKLKELLQRCHSLLKEKSPNHADVSSLCASIDSEVSVPLWFREDIRVCYRWYADGDGGQCGGGVGRHLCASPDHFTQYYRDDTDGRGGGCRMSWGIETGASVPKWFKDTVQFCYRWYPDGDGGQCGGGVGRLLCAKVGQYTQYYRDDTDGRGGGCQMSWKLTVGSHAPLWANNLNLCYQWYPDGDGGQCGGGVGRDLHALANAWTQYYRDDTDGRGGGCRMRWGIKTT